MRDPAETTQEAEPLVRLDDLGEYRRGLERHLAGEWDDERWTAWRVRFGVYGQRQPGVQMVRVKVPGGILPTPWLKTIAAVNRAYCQGDAHITTRQDFQLYHVPLERSADMLHDLYSNGVTTREACGNTLRNMNACALAGACPRELVDAGAVAAQLARSWIRRPLVQHMPRKVKIGVSGCATDCGGSSIHDIGIVAVERDGARGFRVFAGGGLGSAPRAAVEILDFVAEDQLPRVVEAMVRLHQRYSDRVNRNAARMKFLVKRFGEAKFVALFRAEFDRLGGLAQRPWENLAWRAPTEAPVARTPVGVVHAHDGSLAVVAYVPLGLLSSDQLDGLHAAAIAAGVSQLRTTRDQNIAFLGVTAGRLAGLKADLAKIGLGVPESPDAVPDVISCPGTTTCRIGITNSQTFARHIEASGAGNAATRAVSVHVSGCQNSCGLHHVADIGLHGMAKKIDGRSAPHYQIHLGGDVRIGEIGLAGPIVPARLADRAVELLQSGYVAGRRDAETVRAWAGRLGKDGLAALLAPLDGADADGLFVDWGEAEAFAGAPTAKGECAAPFASDELLNDLADDALITLDRLADAGRPAEALAAGADAALFAARRLLAVGGQPTTDDTPAAVVFASLRGSFAGTPVAAALDRVEAEQAAGAIEPFREAVATLLDTARAAVEAPPAAAATGDFAAIMGAAG